MTAGSGQRTRGDGSRGRSAASEVSQILKCPKFDAKVVHSAVWHAAGCSPESAPCTDLQRYTKCNTVCNTHLLV